ASRARYLNNSQFLLISFGPRETQHPISIALRVNFFPPAPASPRGGKSHFILLAICWRGPPSQKTSLKPNILAHSRGAVSSVSPWLCLSVANDAFSATEFS